MTKTIRDILVDQFWADYADNMTPDLTYLRYDGPIPVFMYGHYSSYNDMEKIMVKAGLKAKKDWKIESGLCNTDGEYCFLNNPSESVVNYKSFLLPPTMKIKDMKLTRRKIRGTLYTVSLAGLQALDRFFMNRNKFYRDVIDIEDSKHHNFDEAFSYIVKASTLTDKIADEIELKEGLKLTFPIQSSVTTGGMVYV